MGEMGSAQVRHFARSHIQPRTGTLSYHFMGVWQRGQREPGATIDNSSGIRRMQTLRKLPISSPNTKMNAITKVCAAPSRCYALCHTCSMLSTQPRIRSVRCLTRTPCRLADRAVAVLLVGLRSVENGVGEFFGHAVRYVRCSDRLH